MDCVLSVTKHKSQMFSYLHLKLVLHNMKMNCKIHTTNLKVDFLLLRMTINSISQKGKHNELRETVEERELLFILAPLMMFFYFLKKVALIFI